MNVNRRFSFSSSLRNFFSVTILILSASVAIAQVHGVPASVTSLAPGHGFRNPPGVPASVTSLGPRGFTPGFRGQKFNHNNRGDGTFFGPTAGFGFGTSFFVPSFVVPFDTPEVDPNTVPQGQTLNGAPVQQQALTPSSPQTPTIIVIDNRGVHDATTGKTISSLPPGIADQRGSAPPEPIQSSVVQQPEEQGPKTLVVFRDGKRKEVQNYAIMGKEFIDLSNGQMHRYLLADVDVPATIEGNNERGVEFRLPQMQ